MLDASQYIGKELDEKYLIVREIGHGASSAVFYAEDVMTKQQHDGEAMAVAIKILDKDTNEYKANQRSFETESRAVVDIPTNSHTVSVIDVCEDKELGIHFIVMEYVKGMTLSGYMRSKGALSPREVVSIGIQLLDALSNAHSVGVVHRDVKPQNILVKDSVTELEARGLPGGEGMPYVKLADFGIALLPDEDLFDDPNRGVGTARYVSPEQGGNHEVDARSDLYSLGVVMYELVTGRVPFDAETAHSIISQHQTAIPKHPREYNPNVPLSLCEVIMTAMQKDPSRRFKDAAAMRKKLVAVLHELDGNAPARAEKRPAPAKTPYKPAKSQAPKHQAPKSQATRNHGLQKLWLIPVCVAALALLIGLGAVLLPLIGNSLGGDKITVTVPRLIGTLYDENATYADGITVVPEYIHSTDVEAGYIISQNQGAGKVIHGAVTINVTVSLGPSMLDFSIPLESRVDFLTAKTYVMDEYRLVEDILIEVRAYDASLGKEGSVIGARLIGTEERELSITDGKLPEIPVSIKLVLNGNKKIRFTLPQENRADYDTAKSYIESNYIGIISVSAEIRYGGSNEDGILPRTVIGAYINGELLTSLDGVMVNANMPLEVVLVIHE